MQMVERFRPLMVCPKEIKSNIFRGCLMFDMLALIDWCPSYSSTSVRIEVFWRHFGMDWTKGVYVVQQYFPLYIK